MEDQIKEESKETRNTAPPITVLAANNEIQYDAEAIKKVQKKSFD